MTISDSQRAALVRWFWRSCFSRRYSAGVIRNLNRDIEETARLRERRESALDQFAVSINQEFFEQTFTFGTVNTRTFILLLASQRPLSIVSGTPVSLSNVLQAYNRNEFHHLMPQAFLKSQGYAARKINSLANFAIISASDNKALGGVAPSRYKDYIPAAKLDLVLDRAICPREALFSDNYDVFLSARARQLVKTARTLMENS
jgi:hypothetical protein